MRRPCGRSLLRILRFPLIASAALILFCLSAETFPNSITKTHAQDRGTDQRGSIRVDVNLVNVIASVLDKNNRPAPDLHARPV